MKKPGVLLLALFTVVISPQSGVVVLGAAPASSIHRETTPVEATVPLYLANTSTETYLTGSNGTAPGILEIRLSPWENTTVVFPLREKITGNITFPKAENAMVSLWLRKGLEISRVRLGTELAGESGTKSCGRNETTIVLTGEPAEYNISIPLDCEMLAASENLELKVSMKSYIGMLGTATLYTGGERWSRAMLPVANFARLVMDLEINGRNRTVKFSADIESPLKETLSYWGWPNFNITGPTRPKSLILTMCGCNGIWNYGRDGAKKGRYLFAAYYTSPLGPSLMGEVEFELAGTPLPEDLSLPVPFVLVVAAIIVVAAGGTIIFKRWKKSGRNP